LFNSKLNCRKLGLNTPLTTIPMTVWLKLTTDIKQNCGRMMNVIRKFRQNDVKWVKNAYFCFWKKKCKYHLVTGNVALY